jgi:hypothetical protein
MKSSYFTVGRKLTPEEWGELKSWRAANPDLRWKKGEARADGLVFYRYGARHHNGEQWATAKSFATQEAAERARKQKWGGENAAHAKAKAAAWYAANSEAAKQRAKEWVAANPERAKTRAAAYYEANASKIKAASAAWQSANRDRVRIRRRRYKQDRCQKDPVFDLECRLRRRTHRAFSDQKYRKTSPTSRMLGCSWEEARAHIEALFVDGMSWDNRSRWHIDHSMPLASAKTEEELVALCHYTNLQPLWAEDNHAKGCKLPA